MRLLGAGRAAEGAGSAADDEGLLLLAIDDHAFPFTTGPSPAMMTRAIWQ